MTIRDRTRPRTLKPRKGFTTLGSTPGVVSPTSVFGPPPLDREVPVPRPTPSPLPVPAPAPNPVLPPPVLYPEPTTPVGPPTMGIQPVPTTPMPKPVPPLTPPPLYPEPPGAPTQPRPPYPEGPNTGIPGGPGGLQPPTTPAPPGTIPPGYGLDFVRQPTPNELVANQLNGLLDQNSAYMENARRRGLEYANSRGNINSSIGAGASERAALEAALPIAQLDAQVYRDANAANFDAISNLRQMRTAAQLEDWLSDNSFNREYNGRLAMMPIQSSMDMMAFIAQRAAEDPAVWTPDVMSGWMNFFNMWQGDMFSTLLGGGGDE